MATIVKKVKEVSYSIKKQPDPNQKCPPQAKLIIDILSAQPDTLASRDELLALLGRPAAEGGLTTTQTPAKILGFYQPKLVEQGILEVHTKEVDKEVEVPDKPEKPSKTKAKGKKVDVSTGEEVKEGEGSETEPVEGEGSETEQIEGEEQHHGKKVGKGKKKVAA